MIAKLCLHNLRDLLGISQVEGHIRKGWIQHTTTGIVKFTTLSACSRIFRIQTSQRSEGDIPSCNTVGIVTQLIFHTIDLLLCYLWRLCDDRHLYLCGHERNTVFRQVLEEVSHFGRCHIDILHQFLTHLLRHLSVTEIIVHLLAHLCQRLLTIFLQFLTTADQLYPVVDLLVDSCRDLALRHLYTVDGSLMQEQFLYGDLLGDTTVGITRPFDTLRLALQAHLLYIRLQDRLITHHPDYLIDNTGLMDGSRLHLHRVFRCRCDTLMLCSFYIILYSINIHADAHQGNSTE